MPKGLSTTEAGHKLAEHVKHQAEHPGGSKSDRRISIVEAALLSTVSLVVAWSGYSAAKWGTESSLDLAKASATRVEANRAYQEALTYRVGGAVAFNGWFAAHAAKNESDLRVAEKYIAFLPGYGAAFRAWLATKPFTNPNAPAGPEAMPQYRPPGAALARTLDAKADDYYFEGQRAAETGNRYIRATVILAMVLFLVGISTQFPLRRGRYALISVGFVLLLVAGEQLLSLPAPP